MSCTFGFHGRTRKHSGYALECGASGARRQVRYLTDTELDVRDVEGDQGRIIVDRVTNSSASHVWD